MAISAISSFSVPLIFTAGGLALFIVPWLIALPRLSIIFLLFSVAAGQLVRFPLPGQGGGILLSDVAVVIVLISAVFSTFSNVHNSQTPNSKTSNHKQSVWPIAIGALFTPFLLWSALTLAVNSPSLGSINTAISLSYWLRLAALLLLMPALLYLARNKKVYITLRLSLLVAIALLSAVGLCQVILAPNLAWLARYGWDPHQNRLVSTWLDPNFFGAFLALSMPYAAAALIISRKHKVPIACLLASQALALLLTQSRSSFIALITAFLLLSPVIFCRLYTPKKASYLLRALLILSLIMLFITISIIWQHERISGLFTFGPTVQLRWQSLVAAWSLASDNSFLGVGYNAYQFAALKANLISDFTIHSRAGADNSFLTLWVTTGLIGLTLFLMPWIIFTNHFLLAWIKNKSHYSLAALMAIMILFIHALFINSLLYSHLLITLEIIIALALNFTAGLSSIDNPRDN